MVFAGRSSFNSLPRPIGIDERPCSKSTSALRARRRSLGRLVATPYLRRMALSICPSAICRAPVERVWSLLADPQSYGSWSDAAVDAIFPPGPIHAGQRIRLCAPARSRRFLVRFLIERVDHEQHVLELRARFPLGLVLQSRIAVTAIDATTSRVQYG